MNHSDNSTNDNTQGSVLNSTSSASLEKYYSDMLMRVQHQLPEAAVQMKSAGVARVEVYYDGCGDSGQIESLHYFDANYSAIDPAGQLTISHDKLIELFYDLIEVRYAGWENNDGAFGTFEWELISGTLNHSHSERYVECETTEVEGL